MKLFRNRKSWANTVTSWKVRSGVVIALILMPGAWAQLQPLPDKEPQALFAGASRKVIVFWHNPDDKIAEIDVRMRLYQVNGATVFMVSETPWKRLRVLPGQTVVEAAALDFPLVRSETRFL